MFGYVMYCMRTMRARVAVLVEIADAAPPPKSIALSKSDNQRRRQALFYFLLPSSLPSLLSSFTPVTLFGNRVV